MNNAVLVLLTMPFIGSALAYILGKIKKPLAFWVAEVVGGILFLASLVLFFKYSNTPINFDIPWIHYGNIVIPFGIYIDHLSIVMLLIATGLGFVDIHFAHDYMGEEKDQARYYSKVLFFIGGMIILVITKDLIGAFVGWEFMGLASYVLISFWYYKKSAANAGMQAFLYTRFGDIFILAAIAILMIYAGTTNLVELNHLADTHQLNKTVALIAALFIFMGLILEKSKIAQELLETIANLFGKLRGGLGFTVIIVGALLAASTGIVGATVVTMGLLTLPTMLKWGYDKKLASGLICASGTLGQIIPPSIALILLSDVLQGAYSQSQLLQGKIPSNPISTIDLFAGAILPGVLLVILYCLWLQIIIYLKPQYAPHIISKGKKYTLKKTLSIIFLPIILIILEDSIH